MNVNIVVGGAVYTHQADDSNVAVVLDLAAIDSADEAGPEGDVTEFRFVLSHAHAVQLGTLIIQHAGPFDTDANTMPTNTEESN